MKKLLINSRVIFIRASEYLRVLARPIFLLFKRTYVRMVSTSICYLINEAIFYRYNRINGLRCSARERVYFALLALNYITIRLTLASANSTIRTSNNAML